MKPDAPPSSKATSRTSVNSSNGTPADSTAHGRSSTRASRRQPSGDARVLQLQQVDVELVERAGGLDDRVLAAPPGEVLAGQRVDEVLDHGRDADLPAVLDDLPDGLEAVGDQVGLAATGRAVGAQLREELVRVAALVEHPAGVRPGSRWVRGSPLKTPALRRLGRDQQPAVAGAGRRTPVRAGTP